jgi:serine/threonine protein kinase
VHRARDRETGALVALKHMYLQEEGVLPLHVQRELCLLRAVRHPAVVSLLGVQQQVRGCACVVGVEACCSCMLCWCRVALL